MLHHLKIKEEFADAIVRGEKTFEIRINDRGFQKGDLIEFITVQEDLPFPDCHPIHNRTYEITYVMNGWGLKNGYVVFGIRETKQTEWMPCSEMLPARSGEYMVTWTADWDNKYGRTRPMLEMLEFEYDPMDPEWDTTVITDRGYQNIEVTAWKDLPEPYEEDKDD